MKKTKIDKTQILFKRLEFVLTHTAFKLNMRNEEVYNAIIKLMDNEIEWK